MFRVGLTGGIASGKTTVSRLFEKLGVPIVDTDVISRKLLDPGEAAYEQVVSHFSEKILGPDGAIDRPGLRALVFSDSQQKVWLEQTLHPLIYRRSQEAMAACTDTEYVLLVVPLLFETGFQSLVDRVLVVDCPREQQIRRLMRRDSIDEQLAIKMLEQQMDGIERASRGDDVIENNDDTTDLGQQVAKLHQYYLKLASAG